MDLKMPPLTKSKNGFSIWIGRLLIHLNWARTLIWSEQSNDGRHQKDYYFSIHLFKRQKWRIWPDTVYIQRALGIIIGPLKISIGVRR